MTYTKFFIRIKGYKNIFTFQSNISFNERIRQFLTMCDSLNYIFLIASCLDILRLGYLFNGLVRYFMYRTNPFATYVVSSSLISQVYQQWLFSSTF